MSNQVLGYDTNSVLHHPEVAVPTFALEKIIFSMSVLLKQQSAVVPVKAPVVPLLGFWLAGIRHRWCRWWYRPKYLLSGAAGTTGVRSGSTGASLHQAKQEVRQRYHRCGYR